jgi:hypothetical protein
MQTHRADDIVVESDSVPIADHPRSSRLEAASPTLVLPAAKWPSQSHEDTQYCLMPVASDSLKTGIGSIAFNITSGNTRFVDA